MLANSSNEPRWRPLSKIGYGFVVYPFTPSTSNDVGRLDLSQGFDALAGLEALSSQQSDNPYQIALEVGDEVYVFEEFNGWYRGYVVSTVRQTEEPQVFVGIFPVNHVHIREYLEDAERRLAGESVNAQTADGEKIDPNRRVSVARPHTAAFSRNSTYAFASNAHERPPPPLPSLKCGDETLSGTIEPLVDEIASALREWSSLLYKYLDERKYELFNVVKDQINYLFQGRRQLLAQTLSQEEMTKLRKDLVSKLVAGNLMQGLDIIVRHPEKGYLADETNVSAIQLYRMQSQLAYSETISPSNVSTPIPSLSSTAQSMQSPNPSTYGMPVGLKTPLLASITDTNKDAGKFYHIYLDLRAFVASISGSGETSELYFSLYNRADARFLTEEYCVVLTSNGMPRDESKIGRIRTLFTDLSHIDIQDQIYLVCRIVRNGQMKFDGKDSANTFDPTQDMTSPRLGEDSTFEDASMISPLNMVDTRNGHQTFRRPFGCAVLEISQLQFLNDKDAASEHVMPIFTPTSEATFATLHEDIIANKMGKEFERSSKAEMVCVFVKVFHGEAHTIVRENPSLLQDVPLTSRLGFPDVVFPGDSRNEMYLKLWSGDFSQSRKTSLRNIQVTVEVRLNTGQRLDRVISRGSGESLVTQYDSMIYYHNNTPTWGELMKICVPVSLLELVHIFFTFRHRSTKDKKGGETVFAFAYLPLFPDNRAFLHDGGHSLALYRYDRALAQPNTYLREPFMHTAGLQETQLSSQTKMLVPLRDSLSIRTFLCSTKYTQNEVLLKLLNWERVLMPDPEELQSVLTKFAFVGEVEIVKFLQDIFDALFGILSSSKNNSGEVDDLVFNAMVTVLGIVADRRFVNFRPVLDVYIDRHFNWSAAYPHIIKAMNRLLSNPTAPKTAQILRSTIKVWEYLFKFIIRGRELQRHREQGIGLSSSHIEDTFKKDLSGVLRNIDILMAMSSPAAIIGTQTVALQHFASILGDLSRVYDQEDLLSIAVSFVDSIHASRGKLVVYKLLLIQHLCKGVLFENSASRRVIVANVVRWIRPHFGRYDEYGHMNGNGHSPLSPTGGSSSFSSTEVGKDASRVSWHEGVRLCVTILAVILDKLQDVMDYHRRVIERAAETHEPTEVHELEISQDTDSVSLILPLLPKLLESYKEFQSVSGVKALSRHQGAATTPSHTPTVFPTSYPFSLITSQPRRPETTRASLEGDPAKADNTLVPKPNRHHVRGGAAVIHAGLGEIAAVILVVVFLTSTDQLASYFSKQINANGGELLSKQLIELFQVSTSILRNEAYPADWLNVNILAHKIILKLFEPIADIMEREFIPDRSEAGKFDTAMWRDFFVAILTLLSSDQLVIEDFTPQKRRAVWRLAGDIRGQGARILADLWEAIGWPEERPKNKDAIARLGGYQVQFIPGLVEPVLELCLSHHDELRNNAVQVLFSMIVSEYNLNDDFSQIEAEIIDKLDKLFMSETKGDEISRAFFIGQLRTLFETSPSVDATLQLRIRRFLDSVNQFLDLLLSVRNLPEGEEYQDDRIMGTLKLMKFIKGIGRNEIYVKYVHQLVSMQLVNHNYVEAALTLKLHADLYEWNLEDIVEALDDLDLPRQSAFARKETLCLLMLDHFTKGKAWESAIGICKELTHQYETYTFNYARLAELLQHEAVLYDNIVKKERYFNEYFRVGFYGRGFPVSLQNKQFIYRGFEWEKIGAFCERMQNKHPSAQLLKSNTTPHDDILYSDGQFLQVTAVTPEPDRDSLIFKSADVPAMVRNFYERNSVNKFSFSRPVNKNIDEYGQQKTIGNEFVDLWTEKTTFTSEEVFPTVLRRSEVINVTVSELSPIENAVSAMETKNRELLALETKYKGLRSQGVGAGKINTNPLSMSLNGAVDAPVNGGVPMYKKAFFGVDFMAMNPDKEPYVKRLREALDMQVEIIDRCLQIHDQLVPPEMRPFHDTLVKFFHQNFAEEIARLPERQGKALERTASLRPQTASSLRLNTGRPGTADSLSGQPMRRAVDSATANILNNSFVIPPLAINSNSIRIPSFVNSGLGIGEAPGLQNGSASPLSARLATVHEMEPPGSAGGFSRRGGSISSNESSDVGFMYPAGMSMSPNMNGMMSDDGEYRPKSYMERKASLFGGKVQDRLNSVRNTLKARQRQGSQ